MQKILFLCTGNSARSQMAEAILKQINPELEVYSAGTLPARDVHPLTIAALREIGIDISSNKTKSVDQFLSQSFDYVITVCDNARETCPVFLGKVAHQMHIGFEDPASFEGDDAEKLAKFREVRDQIYKRMRQLSQEINN